jgi:hypothetical protein
VDSAAIDWIAVSRNVSVEQLAAITTEKTRQAEHEVVPQNGARGLLKL